jgi:RNA polymerase sigma-70 factor, ECF subfamily
VDEVSSIDELFGREFARLVRVLGVAFDALDVADAVQEAFIAADRRWSSVSRLDDPAGWIRRVAVNRLLNERRNHTRRGRILGGVRPIQDVDLTDDLLDLRHAFERLAPRVRASAALFYLADLPVDEVAELLGIPPGTVKSNLHEARRVLRAATKEVDP